MNMKVNQINIYGINAAKIASETNKSKYYGKTITNYTPQNGSTVGWKIFYADTNNIYLIADNYIDRKSLPNGITAIGTIGSKPSDGDNLNLNAAFFGDDLRENYSTGTLRIIDSAIRKLNKSYFDQNFTSTNENMKAVAYMLDTTAWKGFKDVAGKATYAIGGPTVEMLFESYNQKHNEDNYEAKAVNESGYQIRHNVGDWKAYTDSFEDYIDASDSLYVIPASNGAHAMWMASPSVYNISILNVSDTGSVNYGDYYVTSIGYRPLICLDNNVQLEEYAGGYRIK